MKGHFVVVFDNGILADPVERGHGGKVRVCFRLITRIESPPEK